MSAVFLPDPTIAAIAEAYAFDAIDFAARSFNVKLDWSDASVEHVEKLVGIMHANLPTPMPPEEAIWNYAKGFGSYVGEVFRKNHGGEWGMISNDGKTYPGMRWKGDILFWPWGRVHKRLIEGDQNNVWHYYKWVLGERKTGG